MDNDSASSIGTLGPESAKFSAGPRAGTISRCSPRVALPHWEHPARSSNTAHGQWQGRDSAKYATRVLSHGIRI